MRADALMHRHSRSVWLTAALAAIFGIKLAVLLQLGDHPLLQPSASGGLDSQYYLQLAQRVAGGDLLLAPGLYFVSPLYIYFLAAVLTLGGGSLFLVKILQIALGTAGCGLVWVAAREWFSERAAWIALALAALTGVFTFYEILILQAALDPFLAALDAAFLALALRRRHWGWSVAAGLALGVHALNRPNMLIVAAGLVCLWLASRDTRRAGLLLAAGFALALLPVSLRNAAAAGTFSPTPSHGGLNLYIGNNAAADGTYHSVPGITPNIAGQAEDARRVAERAEGRRLSDAEVSAYFTRLALTWWRDEPGAASRLLVRKLAYTVNRAWLTLNYSYPFYRDESSVLGALVVGPLVLVPLGLLGLWAHAFAGRSRPARFWSWGAIVPLTVVSVAMFFVASRYRIPLLVPLCLTAGGALDAMRTVVASRRTRRALVAIACGVPIGTLAAWDFHLDDGRHTEETQMALAMIDQKRWDDAERWIAIAGKEHPAPARFHLTVGDALIHAGRPGPALSHLEAARQLGEWSDTLAIDLLAAYMAAGRTENTREMLRAIAPDRPRPAATQLALAQAASQIGDPVLAGRFLQAATVADPSNSEAFEQLGLNLAGQGRWGESIDALRTAVRLSPSRPSAHLNLAVAYAEMGNGEDAREEALRALAADPGYQRAKDFLAALGR